MAQKKEQIEEKITETFEKIANLSDALFEETPAELSLEEIVLEDTPLSELEMTIISEEVEAENEKLNDELSEIVASITEEETLSEETEDLSDLSITNAEDLLDKVKNVELEKNLAILENDDYSIITNILKQKHYYSDLICGNLIKEDIENPEEISAENLQNFYNSFIHENAGDIDDIILLKTLERYLKNI